VSVGEEIASHEVTIPVTVLGHAASELRRVAPGPSQAAELLAQAEMLEENLRWMSDSRYQAASRKQMLYQMRSSRGRRKKGEP